MSAKGLLGVFDDEHKLTEACREMHKRQMTQYDAFTPFPVHGLDEAMGIKRSIIPYVTFAAGLTGFITGTALQWWTSAVDWPINIGGKPFSSWPAFVPVCFELTVLFGGLATAAALFVLCRIPRLNPVVHDALFTDNKFGIFIPDSERGYNAEELSTALKRAGATDVRRVEE